MSMFHHAGPRTRRLLGYLSQRTRTLPARRRALDEDHRGELFRTQAVVFTDTAHFTVLTAKEGILHFLMVFNRIVEGVETIVARTRGAIVKVEGDSLLLRYPDVLLACDGVQEIDAFLRRLGKGKPANEKLAFSYGIGYGEILDIEGDLFGLEVNLASKLGEDLARPGEALLTPAAAATLDPVTLKRVVPYKIVTFSGSAMPVQQLRLPRR